MKNGLKIRFARHSVVKAQRFGARQPREARKRLRFLVLLFIPYELPGGFKCSHIALAAFVCQELFHDCVMTWW